MLCCALPDPSGISDLKAKRDDLGRQLAADEEEKLRVQTSIGELTRRLQQLNEGLARKVGRTETAFFSLSPRLPPGVTS